MVSRSEALLAARECRLPALGTPPCPTLELQLNFFPGARHTQPAGTASASPHASSTTTWSSHSAIWEAMPSSGSTSSALCRFACFGGREKRGAWLMRPAVRQPGSLNPTVHVLGPPSPAICSQTAGPLLLYRLIPHSGCAMSPSKAHAARTQVSTSTRNRKLCFYFRKLDGMVDKGTRSRSWSLLG